MFTIIRADQAKVDVRAQMADIFADGFTQRLGFFSKDRRQIARAFAYIFVESQFYLAMSGDIVAAMSACTDGVRLSAKQLVKFGLLHGNTCCTLSQTRVSSSFP